MSPQVIAAIIAAIASVLTLIGTVITQRLGRRATRRDTRQAFEEQREQLDTTLAAQREQLDSTLTALQCNDFPTLWNRHAPVSVRLRQFAAGRAALPAGTFYPFSARAWTSAIIDRGNTCIRWPDRHGPVQRTSGPFADVPVLVLSGDLDPNTPTEEGRLAARQFRNSQVIEVPNVGHGPESASGCAAAILTDFIRTQQVRDTSCLAGIPPFRSPSKSIATLLTLILARACWPAVAGAAGAGCRRAGAPPDPGLTRPESHRQAHGSYLAAPSPCSVFPAGPAAGRLRHSARDRAPPAVSTRSVAVMHELERPAQAG